MFLMRVFILFHLVALVLFSCFHVSYFKDIAWLLTNVEYGLNRLPWKPNLSLPCLRVLKTVSEAGVKKWPCIILWPNSGFFSPVLRLQEQQNFRNLDTTLQSMMNVKLSKQRFRHCHENGLIKTIQSIPHNL